ncbi:MAG TPA: hypothetical protein VN329_03745 [Roseomonas sp.]|nr:hypothetical protein [Roseomonas sp.]
MPSQTFSDVTIDMLERIAARDDAAGFEFCIDEDRRAGTAAGITPFGEVAARFALDAERAELAVTILRKPPFLPATLLWSEFSRAIDRARAESTAARAEADA